MKRPSNYTILHHIISKWSALTKQEYSMIKKEMFQDHSLKAMDISTCIQCLSKYFHISVEQVFSLLQYETEYIEDVEPFLFARYLELLKTSRKHFVFKEKLQSFPFFMSLESLYLLANEQQLTSSKEEFQFLITMINTVPYAFVRPFLMKQEISEDTPAFLYQIVAAYKQELI